MLSLLLRILLLHFLSFPQHNPRLNSAQSWCFHYIRLYTKLILFSSLYYNFIYILKKKENSNEHITKHNQRILKPLPISKKNGRKNIELRKVDIITASGDYDDTSFMDYNTIINGLNDGKYSNSWTWTK